MTIGFPDVSSYTPVSLAGATVAIARASIGNAKDSHYDAFKADAAAHGVPFLAYHFLNSPSLGVSAEAQADFAFSVIGPDTGCMMDVEANRGANANTGDAMRFLLRYRSLGGRTNLIYLPRWYWEGNLGAPDLGPLARAGVGLVASNYTSYSDTGPGWVPYGGYPSVAQWQYSDAMPFGGGSVDWNAYRGTVAQYLQLANAGGVSEMEQVDQVTGYKARNPQSIGDHLADGTNWRDEWYLKPGSHSLNPPGSGSRFDLLMQAVTKLNDPKFAAVLDKIMAADFTKTAPATVTLGPDDLAALTAAVAGAVPSAASVAAAVIAAHPNLTDADLPVLEAAIRVVLHGA